MIEQDTENILSGNFDSATAANGGEAVDMRYSQGPVVRPNGKIEQHFDHSVTNIYLQSQSEYFITENLHFPSRAYHHLIGRHEELDTITEALHDPDRKPIVVMVGLGAIPVNEIMRGHRAALRR